MDELKEHYANLETDELLRLAYLRDGLREDACRVLVAELQVRGVTELPSVGSPPVDDSPQAERRRPAVQWIVLLGSFFLAAFLSQVLSSLFKGGHLLFYVLGISAVAAVWWCTSPRNPTSREGRNGHGS